MAFVILVAIIFLIINLLSGKSLLKPGALFVLLWILELIMYQSKIIKLNDISNKTIFIICVGVVSFSIGAFNKKRIKGWSSEKNLSLDVNINVIVFLQILSILLSIPETYNSFKILLSGGTFETIRAASGLGNSIIKNHLILVLRNFVITPFVMALYPINAIVFLEKNEDKKRIIVFILTTIIALMMVVCEGGRSHIVYFVLHFVIVSILLKKKIRIPRHIKRWIICFILVAFLFFAYVSFSRGIENLKQSIYMYFCGGISLMDIKISNIDVNRIKGYGLASLSVPIDLLYSLLGLIGITRPPFFKYILNILMDVEKTISVGMNIKMNAFVSLFYYFYLDGGIIGVLLGSTIYGFISSICYNNYDKWKDIKSLAIYCLILQGICFSFIRLQFVVQTYCLSFVILQFLFKRIDYENISNYAIGEN